jgi:hypothetical protein
MAAAAMNASEENWMTEFIRVPGLFRKWEVAAAIDDKGEFLVEGAGTTEDGIPLFFIYRRREGDQVS